MNVSLRKPMALDEFLAWEERQESRYEFDGFRPVAMTGGTRAHAAIQRNLIVALGVRLRGKPCQPFGSELKIQVAGRIRYPDAFVVCTPGPLRSTIVIDPVVVFEILSDSTAGDDLVVKNAEYRETPSIQRYVVLQQNSAGATVFSRKDEDWVVSLVSGPDASVSLPELGISIPLAEIYADIDMSVNE